MKIKEKYKNIRHNGVLYHLGGMNEEKLKMVYDANPDLRYAFEVEEVIENKPLTTWKEEEVIGEALEAPADEAPKQKAKIKKK